MNFFHLNLELLSQIKIECKAATSMNPTVAIGIGITEGAFSGTISFEMNFQLQTKDANLKWITTTDSIKLSDDVKLRIDIPKSDYYK